jgi:serine/threonine protein kinase
MAGVVHFLRCVGKAAVKNGVRALANLLPFGEALFDVAKDSYEDYRYGYEESDRGTDLRRLADLSFRAGERQTINHFASADSQAEARGQAPETKPPVTVTSPTRTYVLHRLLAAGDVADVHLAPIWTDSRVEEGPEYLVKVSRVPEALALLDNEQTVLTDLLDAAGDTTYREYLPVLAEAFPAQDKFPKWVNVFRYEPGFFTLEQIHARHPSLDGEHLAWIFKRLLTVLGFSHRQGIVHGAVLPCHVLLSPANHGLRLVGWGQSVQTGGQVRVLVARCRDWYPPEVLNKQPVSPGTDLFLAARCLIYLAGGDPVRDRMPEAVPAPMRRFVKSCLLEGLRMRPDDAWQLQDEFDELLRHLYGPPKFQPLTMT